MEILGDYSYWFDAVSAGIRIVLWFFLLFGFIAPLFLSYTRRLPLIEKIIYSWVGMGGILIVGVFALTKMNLYDLVSIISLICLTPFLYNFSRTNEAREIFNYLKQRELQVLLDYIRILENKNWSFRNWLKQQVIPKKKLSGSQFRNVMIIGSIAIVGTGARMYSVLQNAAPSSSGWFVHLDRIKNIRLQEYFGAYPDPGGMHALVSVFSLFTQVSPELILHLLGGITSFFLCIIVYWTSRDITKNKYPAAVMAGMAIYALAPLFWMPVSFDQQVDAGSLDLALCFAFPTIILFIRNLRNHYKSPWFYPLIGFTATAMVNLFVAYGILLPLMLLGLGTMRKKNFRSSSRIALMLLSVSLINLLPYSVYCYVYNVDARQFLLRQLYDTQVYSYFPTLMWPLEELSSVYMLIAAIVSLYYIVRWLLLKENLRDEFIFSVIFLGISALYIPEVDSSSLLWFDIDQLNSLYALMIAILISVVFTMFLELTGAIFKFGTTKMQLFSWGLVTTIIGSFILVQGGLKVSRVTPGTIPNGFMKAYYNIIEERQPYTYAIVGPKVQQIMAKNRNFFMEYSFFLEEYRKIDSLYHEQLQLPAVEQDGSRVPPASVFIFAEKAPYQSIQQGILYNASSVMHEVEQWIGRYSELPNRRVDIFYSDDRVTVYELVNSQLESRISNILMEVYPPD